MILITAAHGNQGKALIPRLAAAGAKIRALRISPGGAPELLALGAHEVIIGDAANPAILAQALAGVTSVYHIGPSAHPRERDMGFAIIPAAITAGVQHFVFSSVLHAILTPLIQHELKRDIEELLVSSPLNFTILQPADYMQVLRIRHAFTTGELPLAWDLTRRQSVVDVEDIAQAAAKVLLEGPAHYGATYELSAPGCFTAFEIAAIIAKITGKPIRPVETSPAARMQDHFKNNPQDQTAGYQLRVFEALKNWYSAHDFVGNPNVLAMLLGRTPTTLETYIAREYASSQAGA